MFHFIKSTKFLKWTKFLAYMSESEDMGVNGFLLMSA